MINFYYSLKTVLFSVIVFNSFFAVSQTYNDPDDLVDDVNSATNGGTFIVQNGMYSDFEASFEIMATEANPIIIKAETVGGVTLTGESHFVFKKSAYITLEGFVINGEGDNTLVKLEGCNNIRITRNDFKLSTTESIKWVLIGGVYNDNTIPFVYPSHNNRIDHNIFQDKATPGHYITVDGTTDSDDVAYQSQFDRIDHNHFKNNSPRAVNEQESIRVGWSAMSESSGYTIVEFNLFDDCDGDPEIVSVKSSDNIIRHNTFTNSYGTLSFRHGNRNRAEGNYFFGNGKAITTSPNGATLYTGGIRIYGKDHVIINNYMEGLTGTIWDAPIALTLGDAIDGQSTNLTKHFRAENVLIAYNTLVNNSHGIEIGYDNNDAYNKDLANITIANNLISGSENSLVEIVDTDNDQGDNVSWINNLMYATESATVITGATTTTFDTSEVVNENPNLSFDGVEGVWRTTGTTPLYTNAMIGETISEDIEGQARPVMSNPGADHFSIESIRYKSLTASDVGPDAFETDETSESLHVSSITSFVAAGASKDVNITSNVSWTVSDDSDWISLSSSSGSDNGTISITVSENTTFSNRTGIVTITGGALVRNLNITQEAANPRDALYLINKVFEDVEVAYFSNHEVTDSKNNIAIHTLDKQLDTQWASDGTKFTDGSVNTGGESVIIYDLKGTYDLDLVDIATTNDKTYALQIWVSSTGTADIDFTNAFPPDDIDLVSNTDASFKSFILPDTATGVKYVKIIGKGQAKSNFTTIHEIEFYSSTEILSIDKAVSENNILIYPVPSKDVLYIKNLNQSIKNIQVYSLDGRKVIEEEIVSSVSDLSLDISSLVSGTYLINFSNGRNTNSRMIVISN